MNISSILAFLLASLLCRTTRKAILICQSVTLLNAQLKINKDDTINKENLDQCKKNLALGIANLEIS